MNNFSYELQVSKEPTIGLVVLQADQRIELDMRQLFDPITNMHITRIPSGAEVNTDTLMKMNSKRILPKKSTYIVMKKKVIDINYPKDLKDLKKVLSKKKV